MLGPLHIDYFDRGMHHGSCKPGFQAITERKGPNF